MRTVPRELGPQLPLAQASSAPHDREGSGPAPPVARARRSYWLDLVFGRTLPALFFAVVVLDQALVLQIEVDRIQRGHAGAGDWFGAAHRLLSLVYFTLLVVMYVIRLRAQTPERRPIRIAVALAGTFSVMTVSFLPPTPHGEAVVIAADVLIVVGLAYALWGLAYLRRSFAILPEARRLVTTGPYRLSRHPLYLGEGAASLGVILPVFGYPQALLLILFLTAQALRIRWEEQSLAAAFGDQYQTYRRRVPLLVPFLSSGRAGA
jgi:protein-S-isoprenylcysteine O-methyltransferase Ste14